MRLLEETHRGHVELELDAILNMSVDIVLMTDFIASYLLSRRFLICVVIETPSIVYNLSLRKSEIFFVSVISFCHSLRSPSC